LTDGRARIDAEHIIPIIPYREELSGGISKNADQERSVDRTGWKPMSG